MPAHKRGKCITWCADCLQSLVLPQTIAKQEQELVKLQGEQAPEAKQKAVQLKLRKLQRQLAERIPFSFDGVRVVTLRLTLLAALTATGAREAHASVLFSMCVAAVSGACPSMSRSMIEPQEKPKVHSSFSAKQL